MSAIMMSLLAEKGGVGRTTLTINLAGALAERGGRILLVDMEGQRSLSKFFLGVEAVEELHHSNSIAAVFDIFFFFVLFPITHRLVLLVGPFTFYWLISFDDFYDVFDGEFFLRQ